MKRITQVGVALAAATAFGLFCAKQVAAQTFTGTTNFLGGRREEAQNGHYNLLLYGGTAGLNFGYPLARTAKMTLIPMAGFAAAGVKLNIEDRTGGTFDDVMLDPGRSSSLGRGMFLMNLGVAIDYVPSAGTTRGLRGGVFGLRGGYTMTAGTGPWRVNRSDLEGAPDQGMNGFYLTLTLGRRRPARARDLGGVYEDIRDHPARCVE